MDALDLSPTDIAAGLALVRGAQKEVERERVQVGALCARAGGPAMCRITCHTGARRRWSAGRLLRRGDLARRTYRV